jgi:hypothetical protein
MGFSPKYPFAVLIFLLMAFSLQAQVPLNWRVDEVNPGEDVTLFPDESFFTNGSKSCHLQLNSGDVPYLISDFFYVNPGAEYDFTIDVFDNDTAGQIKVYADFYDTYGFNIFGESPVFSVDSSAWQTISWQGTVPPPAVVGYILIKFYCQPNLYSFTRQADIWIDNIQFRHTGGDNLVQNEGFEDWVVGVGEDVSRSDVVSVYPNPAVDFVIVELPAVFTMITVSDLTGREQLNIKGTGTKQCRIGMNTLNSGTYFLTAYFQDRNPISKVIFRVSDY